jgi:hypothetical protein
MKNVNFDTNISTYIEAELNRSFNFQIKYNQHDTNNTNKKDVLVWMSKNVNFDTRLWLHIEGELNRSFDFQINLWYK